MNREGKLIQRPMMWKNNVDREIIEEVFTVFQVSLSAKEHRKERLEKMFLENNVSLTIERICRNDRFNNRILITIKSPSGLVACYLGIE